MELKKKDLFWIVLWLVAPLFLYSQPQSQSPYSRFGLGDLYQSGTLVSRSLGGQSAAFHDANYINTSNPASFAFLRSTTFDLGVNAGYYTTKSDDQKAFNWTGGLDNINLGISLVNDFNRELEGRKSDWRFGMGIGLEPFSKVGYDTENTGTTPEGLDAIYQFTGEGGTYLLNWSNGIKYKNIAVGLNLGYLYGSAEEEQTNRFIDSVALYHNSFQSNRNFSGFNWKLGAIVDFPLKAQDKEKDNHGDVLSFGAYVQPGFNLRIREYESITRISNTYNSSDSIYLSEESELTGKIPLLMSVGVQYAYKNKYRLGVNYEAANWEDFDRGQQFTYGQYNRLSAGYEIIPNFTSYDSYFQKVSYRIGGYTMNDPRIVNGKQIKGFGVSIGAGLPVIIPRQDIAYVNLGLEIGQLGIKEDITQSYYKVSVSFSLTDKSWFFKQKYY